MLFSIIIPVYNVEPYLRECLDSLLAQTFDDWEAVCVNDGSTDGSALILEEYAFRDARFKVIAQPNGGLSAARNTGMKVASGEYVLFLDSDDWLEKNALECITNALNGEDLLCFSGRRYFEDTKTYTPTDQLTEKSYENGMEYYNENALMHRDFAFVCVVLRAYRRSFLVENKLLFKEGIFHEDNLFTPIVCYYAKKVKIVNACLYNYRVRANSIMTTIDTKHLRDLMGIANELATFFIPKTDFNKTVIYRAITHHYQVVFTNAFKKDAREMGQLCNWKLYRQVSRTKLRHRWNYIKNRIR